MKITLIFILVVLVYVKIVKRYVISSTKKSRHDKAVRYSKKRFNSKRNTFTDI